MKEREKAEKDALVYGTGIVKCGIRKWWNPVRWFKGKHFRKHVSLEQVFK